jgi:putative endonuclease
VSVSGQAAEDVAAKFLQRQGLTIVARNYLCRFGEIDLIARDGNTLVFVEVRMRSSDRFGGAAGSITASKRAKLLRTARHYIGRLRRTPACRFDALLLRGSDRSIDWIKNAIEE